MNATPWVVKTGAGAPACLFSHVVSSFEKDKVWYFFFAYGDFT